MITQIDISNFRSIKQQSIPLKKLNILYGPNGSGKSSVMYAPYVMRNFFVNPNQRIDNLFNLGFINLGGVQNVISSSKSYPGVDIRISLNLSKLNLYPYRFPAIDSFFTFNLFLPDYRSGADIEIKNGVNIGKIEFDLPYNLTTKQEIQINNEKLLWNGLTFDNISDSGVSQDIRNAYNKAFEAVKCFEIISVRRGFFSPIFSTEQANEEALFAMQIRNEGTNFESKIDYYFKQIFNKTFRFVAIPGSTSFYLRTQNPKGITVDLVNEGFGVNQTLYMLIKLLKKNTSLAFIEEPEIHLHPSAQKKLVDVFAEIVEKENKQIFLSTHSENIVSSVLTKIAEGELSKDDVQFYLAKGENDETKVIPQEVNDKGQIEGGLMSFMETELSNLKVLLGL